MLFYQYIRSSHRKFDRLYENNVKNNLGKMFETFELFKIFPVCFGFRRAPRSPLGKVGY